MCIATLLCGLGGGLSPSLQAVALSVITASQNAALFTSFAGIDTAAKLVGGNDHGFFILNQGLGRAFVWLLFFTFCRKSTLQDLNEESLFCLLKHLTKVPVCDTFGGERLCAEALDIA